MYSLARLASRQHSHPSSALNRIYSKSSTATATATTTRRLTNKSESSSSSLLINKVSSSSSSTDRAAISACALFAGAYVCLNNGCFDEEFIKTTKNDMLVAPSAPSMAASLPVFSKREGSKSSAQFRIHAKLEIKEENKKNRLARFLRDIHELAQEEKQKQKLNRKVTLIRRISTMVEDDNRKNTVSLRDIDLLNDMTPELAESLIARLRNGGVLDRRSLYALCKATKEKLMEDPTLVDLRGKAERVTVVGDLHGSLSCLSTVLELVGGFSKQPDSYLVMCGDYVDRGENSLEVFATILLLKLAFPKNVVLLRGNHEDVMIASVYGFLDEVKAKYGGKGNKSWDYLWNELSNVFSALPCCARTESAFIVHGGIPSDQFSLDDVAKISAETRSQLDTIVEPRTDQEKLLEGMMWSDPSIDDGIKPNERGCGIEFGPDVADDFLERHGLRYIIRSHEPAEQGVQALEVGEGRYVVTVFSTADYPNGEGMNSGAVLHLDKLGNCLPSDFGYKDKSFACHEEEHRPEGQGHTYDESLRELIADNSSKLEDAFKSCEIEHGNITPEEWANIMAKELELSEVPWAKLQPSMAPSIKQQDYDVATVDWRQFLKQYDPRINLESLNDTEVVDILHGNKDKLIHIFKFLDVDGNGSVDRNEFLNGVDILNKRHLPKDSQIEDANNLFEMLDMDGNGEIEIEEFGKVLAHSAALSSLTDTLDSNQMEVLHQNREMLLTAFKFLDKDGSGSIDRKEFQTGIELLNKRLPKDTQLKDYDEIFTMLDLDGNGEIDLEEFNQLFHVV